MQTQSQTSEGATHRASCPHCAALYDVPVREIPDGGRRLQCCACGSVWREFIHPAPSSQTPAEDAAPAAQDPPAAQDSSSATASPDIPPEVARILRAEAEREIGARRAERAESPLKTSAGDAPADAAQPGAPERPRRSGGGFAFGVLLAVTGWTLATGVYLWSDGIAGLAPPLAGAMEWYVGAGDWLLTWLRAAARFAQDLATG